ncbi:hypothetical protein GW17_00004303 [Ensete ventricosum]|nr:hypothetical protein GW17_00004303 [Ensete ventricosum]
MEEEGRGKTCTHQLTWLVMRHDLRNPLPLEKREKGDGSLRRSLLFPASPLHHCSASTTAAGVLLPCTEVKYRSIVVLYKVKIVHDDQKFTRKTKIDEGPISP